ncbi:MAG: glycosyltransferase, partial [Acidimicrobiia bacterium]
IVVSCQPNLQEPGVTVVGTLRRTHPEEHAALHAYYGAARAFVLCPDFDAFPNVLLEAQASGVPVISYNDGSRPEAVQHGETGLLVERGDTTALAQAFVVLGRDPVLAAAMGTSAQMRAEQHFTWPGVARHILEELASATNTYSRRS